MNNKIVVYVDQWKIIFIQKLKSHQIYINKFYK